jgi:heme ABC exporter ATP-binding subunit CcmA
VTAPVLELRGLSKRWGRLAVLRGIDLELRAGEIVGLMGHNGSGKTTLLGIAAGLVPPSDGMVRALEAEGFEEHVRARVAFVAHTTQLYPRLTARENLELFAALRRAGGHAVGDGGELLERLGLADAAGRIVGTFSRGMMQRLALARALLGRPDLLLLDEPFTALDRGGRELLATVLSEERDRGAAVLLSSHDFEAMAIADRVVLLAGGVLVGEATRGPEGEGASWRERIDQLGHGVGSC